MIGYSKLQACCMLIVLYVAFIYHRERVAYKVKRKEWIFELLLIMGMISIALDGITAYTVNHLDVISVIVNGILHACFLCSLDAMVFLIFMYILDITRGIPQSGKVRAWILLPFIANLAAVIIFIPEINYRHGEITNYSMGISAYTCFIMVAVYMIGSVVLLVAGRRNMGHNKLIMITTCIAAAIAVIIYQMIQPQALARIMAVADVFDAVSAQRCYRDAMPLDQCFEII